MMIYEYHDDKYKKSNTAIPDQIDHRFTAIGSSALSNKRMYLFFDLSIRGDVTREAFFFFEAILLYGRRA